MPIDSRFQKNRNKVGKDKGVTIWGPVEPPEKLGIRGSNVTVDCDLCTGCGVCLEICPTQVYEWRETSGHPTSKKKAFPVTEVECVQCYKCESRCPEQAIRIVYGPTGRLTYIASYLFFFQAIGGISYGVLFGPSLGLLILFYVGWLTLVVAFFFFFSLIIYFRKRGKPGDGKGLMNTTVLVDSGTYGIIRHPFLLGVMLMMCASILISQHWLTAIVGVPIIVWGYAEAVKEEKGLVVKFGDEYKRYMEKVPRMNLVLGIMRLVRRRLSSKC